jgi:hypothetical protein
MKALTWLRPAKCLIPLVALALVLLGCSTTKKVDWNSRVGLFTYDQAIVELGPPDKQAKLSDGKTVAEWITRRSGGSGLTIGTGYYGGNAGVGVSQSVGSGYSDRSLKLTFDTDGRLSNWSKHD